MNDKISLELTERDAYLRDYLIDKFNKYVELSQSDLLEIGIGKGRFGLLLAQSVARYYGTDVKKELVEIAIADSNKGDNVTYKIGNAENIPFSRQFDIIFYSLSWHFIKNTEKALEEAKRVMHPDGIVAILEPSENTTEWANLRLTKGSPEFDEEYLSRKLENEAPNRSKLRGI